jgi:hypothetical protein
VLRVTFALVALAVPLLSGVAQGARPLPTIRIVDLTPMTVSGTRFAPGGKVKVTVKADGVRRTRVVAAGASGAFRVVFAGLNARDRCSAVATAVAVARPGFPVTHRLCDADGMDVVSSK